MVLDNDNHKTGRMKYGNAYAYIAKITKRKQSKGRNEKNVFDAKKQRSYCLAYFCQSLPQLNYVLSSIYIRHFACKSALVQCNHEISNIISRTCKVSKQTEVS